MKFLPLSFYAAIFFAVILWLLMAFTMLPMPHEVRKQKLEFDCKDFATAETLAIEHFEKGVYRLAFRGERYSSEKSFLLDSILRADYNIEVFYTGCVGTTDEVEHYMFLMEFQLASNHGHDFYIRTRKKVNEILHERKAVN